MSCSDFPFTYASFCFWQFSIAKIERQLRFSYTQRRTWLSDMINVVGCANIKMGNGVSKDWRMSAVDKRITQVLAKCQRENVTTVKLLLLECVTLLAIISGAAESGKSTVLKQMKILHTNGFRDCEYTAAKAVIYENIIGVIRTVIEATVSLNIRYGNKERMIDVAEILEADESKTKNIDENLYTPELVEAIKRVWQDIDVKQCCRLRGNEFHLIDTAEYFMNEIDRICMPGYRPTVQDILRSRVATCGIVEVAFAFNGTKFRVFDVGGQRSERRKWIHCFDNVDAIIFIAAISEYDQMMREESNTNRLVDSLHLFSSISNSTWFSRTNVILFLNKKDIVQQRIKQRPIIAAFPEYSGPPSYEAASDYIEEKFVSNNKNLQREIYSHKTCSTDTNQVQLVLEGTLETIQRSNLKTIGIVEAES